MSQLVKTRDDEVRNSAGGVSFQLTPWQQLQRFLILGSEGGTYYVKEADVTAANVEGVLACIKEDGISVVDLAVNISKDGRAPKNDPALRVLALCVAKGDVDTRRYAIGKLPEVARIPTHLFHFAEYVNEVRGWGRLLREGVANWYNRLDLDKLGMHVVKYQQRDGWSHRDLLRLSHPKPDTDTLRGNLYKYIVKGIEGMEPNETLPQVVTAYEQAKTASVDTLVKLILDHDLPRECIPTEKLNEVKVWEALLENMPMTAMIRTLNKMTSIGLLTDGSIGTTKVVENLVDLEKLRRARVHPLAILVALDQYSKGQGTKDGSLTWKPVKQIVDVLNEAFYGAFGFLEASEKNTMLAIDISGSMTWPSSRICNTDLRAREGAAAMAMVSLRTEPNAFVTAFSTKGFGSVEMDMQPMKGLTPTSRLDQVINTMKNMYAGGTDCALPMLYATKNKIAVDTFAIYTDSETWAGEVKPFEALRQYRDAMGIPAKLVVVGMASNNFTIADPNDAGMLDVVGFDTATPQVIADFSANKF